MGLKLYLLCAILSKETSEPALLDAKLCLYEHVTDWSEEQGNVLKSDNDTMREENGAEWALVLETDAVIGKNGLGKTKKSINEKINNVFSVFRKVSSFRQALQNNFYRFLSR